MSQQDGLGALQMGVAGQRRVTRRGGAVEEDGLERVDTTRHVEAFASHEQPQRGGDLVIPAPAGVQLRARVARELGDPALDRGVDVLVGRRELERALGDLELGAVERREHERALLVGQQPDPGQHLDVRARSRDVVDRETRVERQALGEREQLVGRALTEAAVPQGLVHDPAGPPCSRAHVSTRGPTAARSPAESSWWKVSAAS